tara:strand:- start:1826 stop:3391 length:1566 start_codon:yes stop_codon:yes gene_type:complete
MTRSFGFIFYIVIFGVLLPSLCEETNAQPLSVLRNSGQQTLDISDVGGSEMLSLETLAVQFELELGEDTGTRTRTVSTNSQTVILTADQPFVSVNGQLVSLGAPPTIFEDTWFVPLNFLNDALAPIYHERLELRQTARLLLVGDVSVPRISGRYRHRGQSGQLSLEITPETAHLITEESGRIFVGFDSDAIEITRHPQARGETIRDITVSQSPPGLFLEVGPSYASYNVTSHSITNNSSQLVIEFVTVAPRTITDSISLEPPSVSSSSSTFGDSPPPLEDSPAIRTIVVDAGHGGLDEGSKGANGTLEKDVTLNIARLLTDTLERRLGVRVIQTRTRDTVVQLDRRAAIANNNNADLFISLHANSSVSPEPEGAEVFYLSIDEYGPEAQEIASRERQFLPVSGGGTRDIDMTLWEMAQARYLDQSAIFAQIVEQELRRRVPMSPRAIQEAPFRVLVGANMPAVLIEMGFISNPEQEQAFLSENFQSSIVAAIVESVFKFQDRIGNLSTVDALSDRTTTSPQ